MERRKLGADDGGGGADAGGGGVRGRLAQREALRLADLLHLRGRGVAGPTRDGGHTGADATPGSARRGTAELVGNRRGGSRKPDRAREWRGGSGRGVQRGALAAI